MKLKFQWDLDKAESNRKKHRVSFEEAATAVDDYFSATFRDPDHSIDEVRFVTYGNSIDGRLLVVCHADRGDTVRIISAWKANKTERMKYETEVKNDSGNERREFDFDFSKAEWGKYHRRKRVEGSNIVMIEPDVAKRFRSSAAVNDALRLLLEASKLAEKPKRKTNGRTVKTSATAKKA